MPLVVCGHLDVAPRGGAAAAMVWTEERGKKGVPRGNEAVTPTGAL